MKREGRAMELFEDLHVQFVKTLDKKQEEPQYWATSHLKLNGVYWGLVALHLMGREDALPVDGIIDFVKACHNKNNDYGFAGNTGHDSHLIYTLCGIQILAICGGRSLINEYIDRNRMLHYLSSLHDPISGAFKGDEWGEVDTRFSYIAIQILALLGYLTMNGTNGARGILRPTHIDGLPDTNYINLDKVVEFISRCQNFDGGFGTVPGAESHAGQVFCCVGALSILGRIQTLSNQDRLKKWLAKRQTTDGGLNGRPEKLPDVCYSWWVLSSMSILGVVDWIDKEKLADFILKSQDDEAGGIADRPDDCADVFHLNFGLCGLSLLGYEGLKDVDPRYCLPKSTIMDLGLQ